MLDLFLIADKLLKNSPQTGKSSAASTSIPAAPAAVNYQDESVSCAPSCISAINEAIAPLKVTPGLTSVPEKTKTETQTTSVIVVQPTLPDKSENSVKEFFIPLGTGSSSAINWTDVPGVKAEVDNNSYGSLQKVLFEASVHVPDRNQIVEVRLYNETDKYVVDNSLFLYPSGTTQNFRIAEIQLGSGKKTYQVQMKTQLGYLASLDQARVHITTR